MPHKLKDQYNAYMNMYMQKRAQRRREEALLAFGNKCIRCNGTTELEFHHVIPEEKEFTLAKGYSFSEKRWQEELAKCQLLCRICHTAEHQSQTQCGTPQRYWRGCRCSACKSAYNIYMTTYKELRRAP